MKLCEIPLPTYNEEHKKGNKKFGLGGKTTILLLSSTCTSISSLPQCVSYFCVTFLILPLLQIEFVFYYSCKMVN